MIERTMRLHSDRMTNDIRHLCMLVPRNSVGIEIGSFGGESAVLFAESGKFKKLYCVDPWDAGYYKAHNMGEVEATFDERVKDYGDIIVKVKAKSSQALALIPDPQAVNFVYIDGNHRYDVVKQDIILYREVLRNSMSDLRTILAGHDYKFPKSPGVEKAVKELLTYPDVRFAGYSWVKFI